ncbi:MAG: alpha/beta hydrolase [Elusimicrobiota bacterium]
MTRLAALLLLLSARAGAVEKDYGAVTSDGWRIALHRYEPAQTRFREPVLLSHGFIENRRIWDLDAEHSLARRLSERGFDVWTMELRGSGESQAGRRFSIEDFIRFDAPASIEAVLKETGAPQVLMVGHSLGGLITYATLEGPLAPKVRAAVTLAGAGTMSGGPALQLAFNRFFKILGLTLGPVLPDNAPFAPGWALHHALGENDRAWAELGKKLDSPLGQPFWAEEDVTPKQVEALLRLSVTDTSMNVVRDFLRFAKQGKVDGVTDRLGLIKTPVLAIAGSEDQIIPPSDVRFVAEQAHARYVEIEGAGHEDLCFGAAAAAHVNPLVVDWLASQATPVASKLDRAKARVESALLRLDRALRALR